ncbi:hypothetical protein [Actinoplanes sp. NPDC026619]|uniref:hypothetical protein n=1 Tax=Actinoplanes sp. NPDC026619 TaxID=3155798 RepID=UPI0033CB9048
MTEPSHNPRKPRRRRWLWRTAAGLAAALLIAVAGVVVAYPIAAAAACPACFGLHEAAPGVYVESSATPAQRSQMVDMIAAARQRVRDFYGEIRSDPRILICLSAGCYGHIGGGEKGRTWRDITVALSPGGADLVIAAHELVHAEQYRRLGSRYDRVPRWFNEGLAVVIADDPRYLTAKPAGERCPINYAQALAATRAVTVPAPDAGQDFYRNGACVVDRWLATNGGPAAVHDLNRRLLAGEPFTGIVLTA